MRCGVGLPGLYEGPLMIKVITGAAVMSLVLCSAAGAGGFPSAGGLKLPTASGIVQVEGKGGSQHAYAAGSGRGHVADRGGDFRRGRVARGDYGHRYGYGYGYGGTGGAVTFVRGSARSGSAHSREENFLGGTRDISPMRAGADASEPCRI